MGALAGWRGRAVALLAFGICLGASAQREPDAGREPRPWRVLILCDAPLEVPAIAALTESVRAALAAGAAPRFFSVHSEVIDLLQFDLADHESEYLALLGARQYATRLDLVMAMDSAGAFAVRHRDRLWPDIPIVLFGMSPEALAEIPAGVRAISVAYDFDEAGTLRLARRLQPDAERLVLVAGDSDYDRAWGPRLEAAVAREGAGLEVEYLVGRPLDDVLDRVSRLSPRAIVLYTTYSRAPDGTTFTPAIVVERLSRLSGAPVYAVIESQIGWGVVGGSVESFAEHGRRAAALALRVLGGTPPEAILVEPRGRPVAVVDWRALQRFGLSAAALPPGTRFLNRPPSLLESHPAAVAAVGLALTLQTGLIVALLVQARRRRRAEEEARQQREALAHAARLSTVGELSASITHEINQPLGAILSNAEAAELLLANDPPRIDEVRQILEDIRAEDRRASDVIHEVRVLARKQAVEEVPLDLNGVVGDLMALIEAEGRRRRIAVDTDLEPELPPVQGDPTRLGQVVLNLALNALDAVGDEGPGAREVLLRTRSADGRVELAVSDSGPGLVDEHLPRLFEPFFTTKSDGLGLGLSIVRSIVESHGGQVAAENVTGGGATFRVRLPAIRKSAGPMADGRA